MKRGVCVFMAMAFACFFPGLCQAQNGALSDNLQGLQVTLDNVYNVMITKCGALIGVASGIAGFGSLLYIGYRVWGHLARVEPIDFYPLLRPFAIGIIVSPIVYPGIIGAMKGVLEPTVTGTAALVDDSNKAIASLLQQKQDALKQSAEWQMFVGPAGSGDVSKWEQLSGEADSGFMSGVSNRVKFEMAKASYNLKNSVKVWLSEILQALFEAAALCINTIRTFYLILLAIFGPLVFGLSVFDGFRHLVANWFARYVNVFLWLPIANIFSSLIGQIEEQMIKADIAQLQATGHTSFGETDAAYIVFLILAIVGYFTIPSFAGWIVNVNGHGAHLAKVSGK